MDIEQLKIILNDALNKALVSKDKIKNPNSNKIGDFVNEYITDNQMKIGLLRNEVVSPYCQYFYTNEVVKPWTKCQKCGKKIFEHSL